MPTLLLYGDSERSPAIRHEVPVAIGDPFLFADIGGRRALLISWLERDHVLSVLPDAELLDFFDLGLRELMEDGRTRLEAEREVVVRAVRRLGISEAVIPWDFPVAIADRLRADGITIVLDDEFVAARRRVKAGAELAGVRAAQAAGDAALARAAELLATAEVDRDGLLRRPDGELLLAEWVRAELSRTCAAHDATCPAGMIVASVHNGQGHDPGSGPLPAGLPIIVDVFPRHEATGMWGDSTRTFVVGTPAPAGWATQRTGGDDGFQFSLGHGVGLDVHEPPGLGLSGREPFVAGDVVAVEPGLWDKRIGGVRLEDLLLVTEGGCETLTAFPYDLTPTG
jgi:Xaa-Pro aminopeptidase